MDSGSDQLRGPVDFSAPEYSEDPRRAFDALRERCPVARSGDGSWMVTGHAEVRDCALDGQAFSNHVSTRLQVPNGFDGDEHRRFRALVDTFLAPSKVAALRPRLRKIAEELVETLPRGSAVDAVWQIGAPLAVRCQCAWLGWPPDLEPTLLEWMRDYRSAMRGSDRGRRAAVADRFEAIVAEQIRRRQAAGARFDAADVTLQLIQANVEDPAAPGGSRPLAQPELISILRNWTAGDLGTIAACVGVVAQRLATDDALQSSLRAEVDRARTLESAIDECLRIDDPFLWNRRVATKRVELGGQIIPQGAEVILNWTAANRDPSRFGSADEFRPEENAPHNVVYGVGPHVCPGRELATAQLAEALAALLRGASSIRLAERPARRAGAPMGGYEHVWVVIG